MSNNEKVKGHRPEIGREYEIDYILAYEAARDLSEAGTLKLEDVPELDRWIDYLWDRSLAFSPPPSLHFNRIMNIRAGAGDERFLVGPFLLQNSTPGVDLFDQNGQRIVRPTGRVLDLELRQIIFGSGQNQAVRPKLICDSLRWISKVLGEDYDTAKIGGLTHPRLAMLSRRFGFLVSERPFSPHVYEFVGQLAENPDLISEEGGREELLKVSRQAFVYQLTSEFKKRFG